MLQAKIDRGSIIKVRMMSTFSTDKRHGRHARTIDWSFKVAMFCIFAFACTNASAQLVFASGFESKLPVPMPLISRNRPAFASSGNATAVVDGSYYGNATWDVTPSAQAPAHVAIRVGAGPSRAMINWLAYPDANVASNYRIETSANSSNGTDGTWVVAATISGNAAQARAHSFNFSGQQWVRMVVTQALNAGQSISVNEIDVHDATAGTSDTWMFLGDSITFAAFNRAFYEGNFPERVRAVSPNYFPLMIGAGVGGTNTNDAVAHIDEWIALHPEMQHWIIGYGTNDSSNGQPQQAPEFGVRLRVIVRKLLAAGKTVLVPRIPWKTGGTPYLSFYNAEIDAVRAEFRLPAAPDFYAWFLANPNHLVDGVHPNDDGARAMNQLWADAVRPLYP
jgi:acyl-CoA thioesterase I